jgi:hypothetical protein
MGSYSTGRLTAKADDILINFPLAAAKVIPSAAKRRDDGLYPYVIIGRAHLPPLSQTLTMIALSCAMLAAPLMVVAGAVSSPAGSFAALLAPFQRQGSSGLHARQILVPEECFSTCNPVISTVDVSNPSPSQQALLRTVAYRIVADEFVGMLLCSVSMHDSEHE